MKIESIPRYDFPLPEINDSSYIVQKAILSEDEVVGAIFARLTSELILILDPKLSNFTRARLWKESTESITFELLKRGIKSTHLFITPETDEHYVKILQEKLGFVRATGIPMYLEVK